MARVARIEWARMEGRRPRPAGSNARLGSHGSIVRPTVGRITLDDGSFGIGSCLLDRERARSLIGLPWSDLFDPQSGPREPHRAIEYPVWDLQGRRERQPVYRLAAEIAGRRADDPLRVRCYDTSLYFDDLDCATVEEAAERIAGEAREGYDAGHRAFKVKVGRGARHLPVEEGTRRDVAIARAVRVAIGPDCPLMLDANNGYTLNLTKRVLEETAACGIHWIEEPFHEDPVLYRDLRDWMDERGLRVLIADGEGQASPTLLDWARDGLIDCVQYDIYSYGLTRWIETGRRLDEWGARSAPHHYGGHLGNYASGHLAAAVRNFAFVEWDEVMTPGIGASGYRIDEGWVEIPATPGFGIELDEAAFRAAVGSDGFEAAG